MIFSRITITLFITAVIALAAASQTHAQDRGRQLDFSQQFRLGDRIIRVAEPGQLADTLNVWGDVNSPGRYLIPVGTTLPELISYAFGPTTIRDREANLDWSEMRVEITVSQYSQEKGQEVIKRFKYKFSEPLPAGMRTFNLKNNQVVAVQVKRKPAFVDYIRVVAPVISAIATSILIINELGK